MSKDDRRATQLGMPFGTASHRLRKNILFSFAQRLKEDICFKCKEKINTVEELSIEHKLPWEGRSTDLFWDLNNIAFSHLKCNIPHKYSEGRSDLFKESPRYKRFESRPQGTAWCNGHKDYLNVSLFHSNMRNTTGTASYCKECRSNRSGQI